MKSFILLLCLVATSFSLALAQGGRIKFEKLEHDFGKIKEDGGNVTYKFTFLNTGTEPILISNVQASCGCTTPGWSTEPILPGKEGFVTAQFNPIGRPGPFIKGLTISTNGVPDKLQLTIKGEVLKAEPATMLEPKEYIQYFPYNKKVITLGDPKFQDFLKGLKDNYEKKGSLTFSIESSSSQVPTKQYRTNEALTKARASDARKKILELLPKVGIDPNKVTFSTDRTLVQGPSYKKDAAENMDEYEKYQYVKVLAQ